jgi:hypothetical protein
MSNAQLFVPFVWSVRCALWQLVIVPPEPLVIDAHKNPVASATTVDAAVVTLNCAPRHDAVAVDGYAAFRKNPMALVDVTPVMPPI